MSVVSRAIYSDSCRTSVNSEYTINTEAVCSLAVYCDGLFVVYLIK